MEAVRKIHIPKTSKLTRRGRKNRCFTKHPKRENRVFYRVFESRCSFMFYMKKEMLHFVCKNAGKTNAPIQRALARLLQATAMC